MTTIEDVLDNVDGLRRDAATRVRERFGSVDALASATTEQLTEISGIGRVMADRIHAAAAGALGGQAAAARSTGEDRDSGDGAGPVGKVVQTAAGVAGRAAPVARGLADRATAPARKVVDKVRRRDR